MATTWNPADSAANVTLTNGNLTATSASSNVSKAIRSTTSRSTGKYYFELTIGGTNNFSEIGLILAGTSLTTSLSLANPGFGNDQGGTAYVNGATGSGFTYVSGNVIGLAIDFDLLKFWIRKGGVWQTNAGPWDPATNTGGFGPFTAGTYFVAFNAFGAGVSATANFGATGFANAAPTGFSAFGAAPAVDLAASGLSASTASAALDIKHHLAAAAQSLASASAGLRVPRDLVAAATSLASATAALDIQHHLAAVAAASASASAGLDVQTVGQAHLSAAAISRVATTAALDLQRHMSAAAGAVSNAFAGIDVQHHIAAAAQSVALATANLEALSHFQHLSAGAFSQATAASAVRVVTPGASAGNRLITIDAVVDFGFGFHMGKIPRRKTRAEREAMN